MFSSEMRRKVVLLDLRTFYGAALALSSLLLELRGLVSEAGEPLPAPAPGRALGSSASARGFYEMEMHKHFAASTGLLLLQQSKAAAPLLAL